MYPLLPQVDPSSRITMPARFDYTLHRHTRNRRLRRGEDLRGSQWPISNGGQGKAFLYAACLSAQDLPGRGEEE